MLKFNTHTHTIYSPDGNSTIRQYLDKAISFGVSYIAFTEHLELYEQDIYEKNVLIDNTISRYRKMMEDFDFYKSLAFSSKIYVAIGIEIGYNEIAQDIVAKITDLCKFEYIINSVHYINNESFYYASFFNNRSKFEGYEMYLQEVINSFDAIYSFDTIGHLSYIARNAPFEDPIMHYSDHKSKLDIILDRAIKDRKIIELNSSVKTAKSGVLPNEEILKEYFKRGGDLITFASDSHRDIDLISGWEVAKNIAKRIGFKYYVIKKNDNLEYIKID